MCVCVCVGGGGGGEGVLTAMISWCRPSMRLLHSGLLRRLADSLLCTAGRVSGGNGARSPSGTPSVT